MKNDNIIVKIDEDTLKVNDTDKLLELIDSITPTALDMFLMLEYRLYNRLAKQQENCICFYNHKKEKEIIFDLKRKGVEIWYGYETDIYLNKDEIVAINKQIEELGW